MNQASFWKAHFALLLCLTIGIWGLLFYLVPRGFDMTDNAFYLMAVRNYDDFRAFPTMFQAFTGTLYNLGGESVINLRLLGACVYLAVSILSSIIAIKYFAKEQFAQITINKWYIYGLGLVIITSSTLQYNNWVNSPNYNWLNHIGLMFFLSGLLIWTNRDTSHHSGYAPFLIMLGFGISFWTKIYTATLMPILVILVLIFNRKRIKQLLTIKHVVYGVVGGLLGLSYVFLRGDTIFQVIEKIQGGVDQRAYEATIDLNNIFLTFGVEFYEFLGLLYPIMTYSIKFWHVLLIPIIVVLALSFYMASRTTTNHNLLNLAHFLAFFGWLINILFATYQLNVFQMAVWSLRVSFITSIYAFLIIFYQRLLSYKDDQPLPIIQKPIIGWALLIFFIPAIFSFGSGSSFTLHTGWASHFYLLSAIVILINPMTIKNRFIQYFAPIFMICLIAYVMIVATQEPYRQTVPLFEMTTSVSIQFGDDTLIVGETMADYIIEVQQQAESAGFVAKTPIIDLTRNSPGTVFILDGRSDALPWLYGTIDRVGLGIFILEQWTAEDIEAAWLITTTDSTLESESEILAHFDLDLHTDYEELFTITRPYREGSQTFWRPINIP